MMPPVKTPLPCVSLAFLLLLFWSLPCQGATLAPLATRNQSPLIQIFGLPATGDSRLPDAGQISAELTLDQASHNTSSNSSTENILLDGETTRVELSLRRSLSERMEIFLVLPWVSYQGGFLDDFVIDWHDTFGLPQGGRDTSPRDRLLYRYSRNGVNQLLFDESASGIGDIRLGAAWSLLPQGAATLNASLKLPTGKESELLGSGSTDLALWLSGRRADTTPNNRWALWGAAGVLGMTEGDVLSDQQRPLVGFGSLGAGWKPFDVVEFKLQLDGHTPFYKNSDLPQLADASLQLAIGGAILLGNNTTLDIAVTEDIATDTSPDVVFHLRLGMSF